MSDSTRYSSLRSGGQALARLAPWVRLGILGVGVTFFLDQVWDLVSDAQFTWGERRVMGIIALITLGGSGLVAWVAGRLVWITADLLDVLADSAEASWQTNELIEQHLIPTLGRIAGALESRGHSLAQPSFATPLRNATVEGLKSELAEARSSGEVDRVMDLRDALTLHLRGESLCSLDRELVVWLNGLVERRVRGGTIDAEVARWVARALDSLGDMPEVDPLRVALPALRRRAGLCQECGKPARNRQPFCSDCRQRSDRSATPDSSPRASSARD